jgi:transcriptional regulator with XRE-family HTH domain
MIGPAGAVLMTNIKRIREGLRMTYVDLAERLSAAGRPIPVIGLRRIEKGERRVDVDDLIALAVVLNVAPVDLLVPNDVEADRPYALADETTSTAGEVRKWIGGRAPLRPLTNAVEFTEAVRFMPPDRVTEWMREFYMPIQAAWMREEAHQKFDIPPRESEDPVGYEAWRRRQREGSSKPVDLSEVVAEKRQAIEDARKGAGDANED